MMEKQDNYCNNCGKQGHLYSQCKVPITSYGVIAFRYNPILKENEYLMVCRQNSFGFIDFMPFQKIPAIHDWHVDVEKNNIRKFFSIRAILFKIVFRQFPVVKSHYFLGQLMLLEIQLYSKLVNHIIIDDAN